ncbi:MAG: winged helix-turn-helix transcriptional regulator [Solirubrobacteraceae bacterium]
MPSTPRAAVRSGAGRRGGISLLPERWAGVMLGVLGEQALSADELHERLAGRIDRSPRGALRVLAQTGLVLGTPRGSFPVTTQYALAPCGGELLDVIRALERWRERWAPAHVDPAGMRRLLTHSEPRLIVRALVEAPLPFRELQRRVPGLSAGTLARTLGSLRESGIVSVSPRSKQGHPLHELDEPARRLGLVIALGARWRWRWEAEHALPDAGDLPSLLRLIAPLARLPQPLDGTCQLSVAPAASWSAREPLVAWARVSGGRLAALAMQPIAGPQTRIWAGPLAWCEALLSGSVEQLEVIGDAALARGVIAALAETIAR